MLILIKVLDVVEQHAYLMNLAPFLFSSFAYHMITPDKRR